MPSITTRDGKCTQFHESATQASERRYVQVQGWSVARASTCDVAGTRGCRGRDRVLISLVVTVLAPSSSFRDRYMQAECVRLSTSGVPYRGVATTSFFWRLVGARSITTTKIAERRREAWGRHRATAEQQEGE